MIGPRRPLARACGLLLVTACAQMEIPPGGPDDRTPPTVVVIRPDTFAVVPGYDDPVVIAFSERISEQQVEEAVMVSPRTSPVVVDRRSREVRVSLRRGWEQGQIYHVTVRPLIEDLFNNAITAPVNVVFSTGPAIPATRLTGEIRDRISGEPQVDARVEAIRRADSLVYAVPTDSAGRFVLAHIPEGEYLVRAFPDPNRNRALDAFEARDSAGVSVTVSDTLAVELSLVMPDSTPPQLGSTRVAGERSVELQFDDHLDPAQELDSTAVEIVGPDSVAVPVVAVSVGSAPAADDTAASERPALPSRLLVAELAEGVALVPEAEYLVRARGVRNVVGLVGDSEGDFTAPELPAEPDAPDDPPSDTILPGAAAPDTTPAEPAGVVPAEPSVPDPAPVPEPAEAA